MRKSGKFFEDTLYTLTRKGMRCFSVSQVYQNPEQSGFGAALSSLAQMSPFVRTPADAIESYAAAGCFPIIGFFIQKRVASLFSCRRSFLLSPSATYSAHPADRAAPPHDTKKRQPLREGVPQIIRAGETTSSQALFRRP